MHRYLSSGHLGQLAPTTHPQCRLVSNPCPAGRDPVMHLLSGSRGRVILNPQGRNGALDGAKASRHFSTCPVCQAIQQIIAVWRIPFQLPTMHAHAAHTFMPTCFRHPHLGRTLAAPVLLRLFNT